MAFSPDGRTLASASISVVQLWDTQTSQLLTTSENNMGQIGGDVAFSPDGNIFVSAENFSSTTGWDNTMHVWDAKTDNLLYTLETHFFVECMAFSGDGRTIAVGGPEAVQLWDAKSGQALRTLTLDTRGGSLYGLAFTVGGLKAARYDGENTIQILDVLTGRPLFTLTGRTPTVFMWGNAPAALSPDGRILASGGDDNTLRVWDLETGQLIYTIDEPIDEPDEINTIGFSLDGGVLVISGLSTTQLRNAETGQLLHTLESGSLLSAIAFSPDGRVLALNSPGPVSLWDVETGQYLTTLEGHRGGVGSLSFSPDGQMFVSGGDDGTVRLWGIVP